MRVVSIWSLELQRVILCQFQISCNSFYILRKTTLAKPSKKLHTSPSGVILIQCLALYYKISFFPTSTRQNPTKSVTWRRPHPRSFLWNCELFVFGGNPRNILMIAAALEGFVLSGCLLHFTAPLKWTIVTWAIIWKRGKWGKLKFCNFPFQTSQELRMLSPSIFIQRSQS